MYLWLEMGTSLSEHCPFTTLTWSSRVAVRWWWTQNTNNPNPQVWGAPNSQTVRMVTLPEGSKEKYDQNENKILSQKELGFSFQTSSTPSSGQRGVSSSGSSLGVVLTSPWPCPDKELQLCYPLFLAYLMLTVRMFFGEFPSNSEAKSHVEM